jgi:hypothetical protein
MHGINALETVGMPYVNISLCSIPTCNVTLEHLHRARLFAIFERMTTTRVGLSLAHPNQKLSGDELYSKAHPPRYSVLFAKPRERVRATREGLVSSIWTRHQPTSWTIRRFPTSIGSSSTRSTTTIPSRWTPRSECASNSHHDPF